MEMTHFSSNADIAKGRMNILTEKNLVEDFEDSMFPLHWEASQHGHVLSIRLVILTA
jgi:hypothetical protein